VLSISLVLFSLLCPLPAVVSITFSLSLDCVRGFCASFPLHLDMQRPFFLLFELTRRSPAFSPQCNDAGPSSRCRWTRPLFTDKYYRFFLSFFSCNLYPVGGLFLLLEIVGRMVVPFPFLLVKQREQRSPSRYLWAKEISYLLSFPFR